MAHRARAIEPITGLAGIPQLGGVSKIAPAHLSDSDLHLPGYVVAMLGAWRQKRTHAEMLEGMSLPLDGEESAALWAGAGALRAEARALEPIIIHGGGMLHLVKP